MEMQVGRRGVAGIADLAQDVAVFDLGAGRDLHAARLHVRIERERPVADVEHDKIPVGLVDRQVLRQLAGRLLRKVVARGDHRAVGHGDHVLAEDRVVLDLAEIAFDQAVLLVDLLPVDGEALGEGEAAVERQQGAHVPDRVAAAVARQITLADQRRPQQHRVGVDHRCLGDGERKGRVRSALLDGDRGYPVDDAARHVGARCHRHMHKQDAELSDAERGRFGTAAASDREALADVCGPDLEQELSRRGIDDIDLREVDGHRRRVGEPQLVDEVALVVGAVGQSGCPQDVAEEAREHGVGGAGRRCRQGKARQESDDGGRERAQLTFHSDQPLSTENATIAIEYNLWCTLPIVHFNAGRAE